jgi:hypothetical protein
MNNNTQIETVEEAANRLRFVIGSGVSDVKSFVKGAEWRKQQDEAEIKRLNDSYEDSLSMQRCSNAGYESKINEWEAEYKQLLDSHNELLEGIKEISEVSNGIGVLNQNWLKGFCEELINKAKNIKQ